MGKLLYGFREGKLLSVSEVQRGLDCGCTCPNCGSRLVAKKGLERREHFSHFDHKESVGCLETVLHQRAKELLVEEKKIMLPPVYRVPATDECLFPFKLVTFEKVEKEVELGNGRADVIGYIKNFSLAIEIAVTHKVSKDRIFDYRELGHAAVEIDVRLTNIDNFNDSDIRSILEGRTIDRRWICNQHIESSKLWKNGQRDYGLNSQKIRKRYYSY